MIAHLREIEPIGTVEDWRTNFINEIENCTECRVRQMRGYCFCRTHYKMEKKLRYAATNYDPLKEDVVKQHNRDNRFNLLFAFLVVNENHANTMEVKPSEVLTKIKEWNKQCENDWYHRNVTLP
jgi:hypothetical protein